VTSAGQRVNHFPAALDIVAHELTHGVTDFSSGLIYEGESGALNEAFSDIMATAAEFFHQPRGTGLREADYIIGEDVFTPGGIRALSNPSAKGDPDHYSVRYQGTGDNGGVHTNSGIANHAYYLAIEGGTNRTSRMTVQGVGNANREQIEKIFYRAFVFMLPSTASFSTARAATIQAARDLYGDGSAAARAVTDAWSAVGVF
jgi:bacillolysin